MFSWKTCSAARRDNSSLACGRLVSANEAREARSTDNSNRSSIELQALNIGRGRPAAILAQACCKYFLSVFTVCALILLHTHPHCPRVCCGSEPSAIGRVSISNPASMLACRSFEGPARQCLRGRNASSILGPSSIQVRCFEWDRSTASRGQLQ